jgi:hypothetical protein
VHVGVQVPRKQWPDCSSRTVRRTHCYNRRRRHTSQPLNTRLRTHKASAPIGSGGSGVGGGVGAKVVSGLVGGSGVGDAVVVGTGVGGTGVGGQE